MLEQNPDLTILILCLNEENSIVQVVNKARGFLERKNIRGEIIVVDNNSIDRSAALADEAGARVVVEKRPGYGCAIQAGIDSAKAEFIILGDGDGEHDLGSLDLFWEKLSAGFDLVIGNRFSGNTPRPRTMSFWLRYMGNLVLSGAGRRFTRASIGDFNCGLRAFRTASMRALDLRCPGMECASEMIVKAAGNLSIVEVPVIQQPALDPLRSSHLRVWRDGWRHMRLILMLSPRWLFLRPAFIMLSLGALAMTLPLFHPVDRGGIFGTYTMIFGMAFFICGTQAASFSLLANVFCERVGVATGKLKDRNTDGGKSKASHDGTILVTGFILVLGGLAGSIWSLFIWTQAVEADPDPEVRLHVLIPSVTALISGMELIFLSFLYALLTTQAGYKSK